MKLKHVLVTSFLISEFTMRSKFKGKYLEVEPLGISHLVFPNSGNHYTWRKVKTIGKKVKICPKFVGLVHVKKC